MAPSIDGSTAGRDNALVRALRSFGFSHPDYGNYEQGVIKSARGLYLAYGMPEEQFDELEAETTMQLMEGVVCQYSLFYHIHARRV